MSRVVLISVYACCAVGSIGCSGRLDLERMREQSRTDPYAESAFFADGMAMRVPPPGTVPLDRRDGVMAPAPSLHGIEAAAGFPLPVTSELIARGRHQYDVFCAVCHAGDGTGQSVMSGNMPGSSPLPLLIGDAAEHPPAELFEVISRGRNRMPAYEWALPAIDRWAVVAYVQTLKRSGFGGEATAR